jgi:hypothetical protein
VRGIVYECETCHNLLFCYKCYPSRHLIHPDHSFKTVGPEYEPVTIVLAEEEDDDDDVVADDATYDDTYDDTDDDTDDDDTEDDDG